MDTCPLCQKKVDSYEETDIAEPFTHYNPLMGLDLWGPFDAGKAVICQNEQYVHFRIFDNETRLVKLGCVEEEEQHIDTDPEPVYDPNERPF